MADDNERISSLKILIFRIQWIFSFANYMGYVFGSEHEKV